MDNAGRSMDLTDAPSKISSHELKYVVTLLFRQY